MFKETADDDIWMNQEKWIIKSWTFNENCRVHILALEDGIKIHILAERRYPLIRETLERMMELRLTVESEGEAVFDLHRFIEKQIDEFEGQDGNIKNWLVQKQTAFGKDFSNPFTADSLLKTIWFLTYHASHAPCYSNEALAIPEQTTTGKEISNPFMAGEDCWVLEVFTTYCCWFNIGAASKDLVLLRKIEENRVNHNLWDIIVDGDLQKEAAPAGEHSSPPAKKNQERVKSILLLAIPDEYLLKFHNVPDAKSLWAVIKLRFRGNDKSKKMQGNNTSSTNEVSTASGNFRVNTAGGTSSTSQVLSTPGADEVIDQDDLEELDIRWQAAMLTVRVQRFIQKTGRNLDFKGKQPVTFDKSNVECYNCHRKGHFAKECKSGRNQRKRSYGDNGKRNATKK
ncbi:ribonuclease H-like domain-containing protein [Tanacetum coccineum]